MEITATGFSVRFKADSFYINDDLNVILSEVNFAWYFHDLKKESTTYRKMRDQSNLRNMERLSRFQKPFSFKLKRCVHVFRLKLCKILEIFFSNGK